MRPRAGAVALALAAALAALALAACGGDSGATATPTATVADDTGFAPGASMRSASGTETPGGIGSYCWKLSDAQQCADAPAPVSNQDPLPLAPGEAVALTFEAGAPTTLQIAWYAVDDVPPPPQNGVRVWANGPTDSQPAARYLGARQRRRLPGDGRRHLDGQGRRQLRLLCRGPLSALSGP